MKMKMSPGILGNRNVVPVQWTPPWKFPTPGKWSRVFISALSEGFASERSPKGCGPLWADVVFEVCRSRLSITVAFVHPPTLYLVMAGQLPCVAFCSLNRFFFFWARQR